MLDHIGSSFSIQYVSKVLNTTEMCMNTLPIVYEGHSILSYSKGKGILLKPVQGFQKISPLTVKRKVAVRVKTSSCPTLCNAGRNFFQAAPSM